MVGETAGVAAAVARARRRNSSHFLQANAVGPDSAVSYEPGRRLERRVFERMQNAGAIRAGASGGWYLDPKGFDYYNRTRRRRVGALIGGAVAVAGGLLVVFG